MLLRITPTLGFKRCYAILSACCWLLWIPTTQANTSAPSNAPNTILLDGMTLQQNGVGIRKKWFFPVYQATLYTHHAMHHLTEIQQDLHPKVIHLYFLRDVDQKSLQEAWREAFRLNCGLACREQQAALEQLLTPLVSVAKAEQLLFWLTKDRIRLQYQQRPIADIEHPAMEQTILAMFLGEHPPTEELKQGLLGLAEPAH